MMPVASPTSPRLKGSKGHRDTDGDVATVPVQGQLGKDLGGSLHRDSGGFGVGGNFSPIKTWETRRK